MISLKVLSTVAVMALVLPAVIPDASYAQSPPGRGSVGGAVGAHVGGGGGGPRMGGGGGPRFSGGGAPAARFGGGGGGGARIAGGGGNWHGGGGGFRRGGGGGFIPGAVAGAVIGGALSQSYGYYGGPGYYAPGYYDDQYYDDSAVAAPGGDDAVAYCMQTYRSYDPGSGTYLGNDGYRHPCP